MDKPETIADIIAEKRRQAEHIRNNLSTVPIRQWDQQAEIKLLEDEAYRLDAAHKRELARVDAVIDEAVHGYPPEDIYDKLELGDCAKLREALENARRFVFAASQSAARDIIVRNGVENPYVVKAKDALAKIDAALAAPPRNCDSFNSGDPMKDAEDAYGAWQRYCDDPMIPPSCKVESSFKNWLFSPATEKEGGAK